MGFGPLLGPRAFWAGTGPGLRAEGWGPRPFLFLIDTPNWNLWTCRDASKLAGMLASVVGMLASTVGVLASVVGMLASVVGMLASVAGMLASVVGMLASVAGARSFLNFTS